MVKEENPTDRDRSRKSSKSGQSNSSSNTSSKKPTTTNVPATTAGSGDRLRPPVSTTSSLARKIDEARLEKKRELMAAAQASVDYEDAQAIERLPGDDLNLFIESCDLIRDSLGKMRVETNLDPTTAEKHKEQVVAAFMEMKQLNRYDKIRLKKARDSVSDVKQTVDEFYLQLQNLLSEIMYIRKEVTRCLDYKSKAEDIDLISLQEFYANAPTDISRPEETMGDEHVQMLARLEWELELRKKLAATLEEQELIKQQSSSVIEKSHDMLNQLRPLLSKVLESLQPIAVELDIPFDEKVKSDSLSDMDTSDLLVPRESELVTSMEIQ